MRLVRRISVLLDLLTQQATVPVLGERWRVSPPCLYAWRLAFIRRGLDSLVSAMVEGPHCRVCVRDDGPGLGDEARALLLQPFAAGRRPDATGAGLGFFLVRQAAARWRARLEVVTAPDKGLRVELFLPLTPPED